MPKLLIAIPTCVQYEGNPQTTNRNQDDRRKACRETWLKNLPARVEHKFFYGRGQSELAADEVRLHDCGDGYKDLSSKFRSICRWALDAGFDWLLRIDDDAYCYVDRLIRDPEYTKYDYSGYTIPYPEHLAFAAYASGAGFLLSSRAIRIVADSLPEHPADDLWTGRALYCAGIRCRRDTRFLTGFDAHFVDLAKLPKFHPYTIVHALRPDDIRELHARGSAGEGIQEPPRKPLGEPDYNFSYGAKSPECSCSYCQS